jgi:TonB family protein
LRFGFTFVLVCLYVLGRVPAATAVEPTTDAELRPIPAPSPPVKSKRYATDAELGPIRAALARMSQATVYSIAEVWDWTKGGMPDTTGVVAGYLVTRSGSAPSKAWVDSLKALLSKRDTYTIAEMLCIAVPGYVVRLRGASDSVTVVLSTSCSRLNVKPARGAEFGGWADSGTEKTLRALIESVLPLSPDRERRSSEGLSAPHNFRDQDCRCTAREGEILYREQEPVAIHSPPPVLPESVRSYSRQLVPLLVLVDDAGLPCRIKAEVGEDPYVAFAVDAIRAWRWKPAMSKGKPLCAWTFVRVEFEPKARVRNEGPVPRWQSWYPLEGQVYDQEPVPTSYVRPWYPAGFRLETGSVVVVRVLVGEDGRVQDRKIIQGVTGLNDSVLDAVAKWTFKPALRRGRPVAIWVEIPFRFVGVDDLRW